MVRIGQAMCSFRWCWQLGSRSSPSGSFPFFPGSWLLAGFRGCSPLIDIWGIHDRSLLAASYFFAGAHGNSAVPGQPLRTFARRSLLLSLGSASRYLLLQQRARSRIGDHDRDLALWSLRARCSLPYPVTRSWHVLDPLFPCSPSLPRKGPLLVRHW